MALPRAPGAHLQQRITVLAGHSDICAGKAGRVVAYKRERQRLGISDQALWVHGYGIGPIQEPELLGIFGAGPHLSEADQLENAPGILETQQKLPASPSSRDNTDADLH